MVLVWSSALDDSGRWTYYPITCESCVPPLSSHCLLNSFGYLLTMPIPPLLPKYLQEGWKWSNFKYWQKQKLSNYQSHWSLIKKSGKHFTHICTIKVRSVPSSPSDQDSETRTGTDQKTRHLALYFLGTWLHCVCCIASCCTTSHSPASHHVISCMVP